MSSTFYSELKLQPYLKSDDLTVIQAKTVFSFRIRMAQFSENYRGQADQAACKLCQLHLDNQPMSFHCSVIRANLNVRGNYEEIFSDNISKEIAETLVEILHFREDFFKNRSIT